MPINAYLVFCPIKTDEHEYGIHPRRLNNDYTFCRRILEESLHDFSHRTLGTTTNELDIESDMNRLGIIRTSIIKILNNVGDIVNTEELFNGKLFL